MAGIARVHLEIETDGLTKIEPLLEMVGDRRRFLSLLCSDELNLMQRHERSGWPLGSTAFVEDLEQSLGRILRSQKSGPKKQE